MHMLPTSSLTQLLCCGIEKPMYTMEGFSRRGVFELFPNKSGVIG
jgi:hypothetical protein